MRFNIFIGKGSQLVHIVLLEPGHDQAEQGQGPQAAPDRLLQKISFRVRRPLLSVAQGFNVNISNPSQNFTLFKNSFFSTGKRSRPTQRATCGPPSRSSRWRRSPTRASRTPRSSGPRRRRRGRRSASPSSTGRAGSRSSRRSSARSSCARSSPSSRRPSSPSSPSPSRSSISSRRLMQEAESLLSSPSRASST